MKYSIKSIFVFLMLICSCLVNASTIKGKITEASSGDPLIGANVIIENTSLGAATDVEGNYVIHNIPQGVYSVRFSYIGYEIIRDSVNFTSPNQTLYLDKSLKLASIEGDEVVVSAQAIGQLSAINQQLSADAMMNIVDAQRIQELPDQNAAESIARLPGITISRNNGEGSGVGIRGLAPQYNQVQIDGVVMSAAPELGRAIDFDQGRNVSLSNISQENLNGIEVYKAITPDMDGATLGGTVNLRLGKAPTESQYEVRLFGGYNEMREDLKQYKIMARAAQRVFDDKLGIQLSINAERRNRGSDRLSGNIQREDPFVDSLGTRITQYRTMGATIRQLRAHREKQSINAIFDYATPGTELLFSNFFNLGSLTSREISRNNDRLNGYKTESDSYTLSNSLRGTHNISNLEIEWQLSHYKTETETPDDYHHEWSMSGSSPIPWSNDDQLIGTPEEYLNILPDDGDWTFFRTYSDVGRISETKFAGKLDLKYPFYFNKISGFFKAGTQLKTITRESRLRRRDLHNGRFPGGKEGPRFADYLTDYNGDPVLNDNVTIRHYFDVDKIKSVWVDTIGDYKDAAYQPLKYSDNQNYDITENYYAGYLMLKLNAFNDVLTIIPGVRFEGDDFDATGYYAHLTNSSETVFNGIYTKRNAKRSHGFWLPMVHLKVKPTDWFDTRLAITKTISRPNYRYRIPFVTARWKFDEQTRRGDPDIKTTESWNFDLSTSFFHSSFGLLTISGFYKEIKNFSFMIDYFIQNEEDAIRYGLNPADSAFKAGHYIGKDLQTPENTHGISTVKGFEIDYQANLRFLPGLFKNITFGINYTRAWSNAFNRLYSVTLDSTSFISVPPYVVEHKTYNIGFRRGRLQTQPDHILNTSIGYDIGGFSGKFSVFFQGSSLKNVGKIAKADTYVEDFLRYDVSIRYRFNDHLSFLLTGVNLSSTADITSLNGTSKHSSYDVYGAIYDFGVQYQF